MAIFLGQYWPKNVIAKFYINYCFVYIFLKNNVISCKVSIQNLCYFKACDIWTNLVTLFCQPRFCKQDDTILTLTEIFRSNFMSFEYSVQIVYSVRILFLFQWFLLEGIKNILAEKKYIYKAKRSCQKIGRKKSKWMWTLLIPITLG